jgi:hypothetical protein
MDADKVMANIGIAIILTGLVAQAYDGFIGWRILAYLISLFGPIKGFLAWYSPLWVGALIKGATEVETTIGRADNRLGRAENRLVELQDRDSLP